MPLLKLPYFDGKARMEMKTVGEGDLLTACTGEEGVVVGFLFLASRALQTRLEKKEKK